MTSYVGGGIELPWDAPDWEGRAERWILTQLEVKGYGAAPIEWIHKRAWSAFARAQTDRGTVYFKAPAPPPDPHFEAALTEMLARLRPDCNLPLIAINPDDGWMLSAEAGITMNSRRERDWQMPIWLKVLPFNAHFQLEMVEHVPELLALGVPDRRLGQLPALYDALLEDHDTLRVGQENCLTEEEYQALRGKRAEVAELCEQLATYGIPETLTHEELHDSNLILDGERPIFVDWSEGSISHPFFTMVNTLRAVTDRIGIAEDGAELQQMREAYLEPWAQFAPMGALLEAFPIAYRLGMINRALSWQLGTGQLAEQHKAPYVYSVSAWLQDFLNGDGIG